MRISVAAGVLLAALAGLAAVAQAQSFYELLQVSPRASTKEIKRAFRKMALKYHPDRNPSPDAQYEFIRIANAYETLADESKRRHYDANPGAFRPPPPPPGHRQEPPPPPGQQPPAPPPPFTADDFDYRAFFKKFDEMLRKHAEAHAKALAGTPGAAEHVSAHLRDHMRLHQETQRQAAAAAAEANAAAMRAHAGHGHGHHHDESHEKQKYARDSNAPTVHINLDDLFDDMTEEEYEDLRKDHESASSGQTCKSRTVKNADGSVTTVTECTSE